MRSQLYRTCADNALIVTALVFLLSSCATTNADDVPAAAADPSIDRTAPAWFVDNVKFLTSGSGRWVTSNAAYQSDQEPWDAYGLEWEAGPANASMTGRLFGIKEGTESSADFWQFAQYWNPETRQAIIQQFGWGQIGLGNIETDGAAGETKMTQRFVDNAGTVRTVGHKSTNPEADVHETTSYAIDAGDWVKERSYIWIRQRAPAAPQD